MGKWYVVQVAAGRENATRDLVERLVPPEALEECFVPSYEAERYTLLRQRIELLISIALFAMQGAARFAGVAKVSVRVFG